MPTEIKIPAVGESITEVTIAKWLKQDGEAVKRDEVIAELAKYPKAKIYWVQEEPENMGYWNYMVRFMRRELEDVVARKPSASPATGYNKVHVKEQKDLVARAFDKPREDVADENIKETVEEAKKLD